MKKMLAILVAVKKWNSYLLGKHFKIKIDHQSLRFLLDQQTNTLAQQQWVLQIMRYDYEVFYRKDISNIVANILLRRPYGQFQAITTLYFDLFDRIQLTWTNDPHLVQLISQLLQGTEHSTKFTWQNSQPKRKGKLVVGQDDTLKTDLLSCFHSSPTSGHFEVHPIIARISGVVYQKGLKKQVRQFVRACSTC